MRKYLYFIILVICIFFIKLDVKAYEYCKGNYNEVYCEYNFKNNNGKIANIIITYKETEMPEIKLESFDSFYQFSLPSGLSLFNITSSQTQNLICPSIFYNYKEGFGVHRYSFSFDEQGTIGEIKANSNSCVNNVKSVNNNDNEEKISCKYNKKGYGTDTYFSFDITKDSQGDIKIVNSYQNDFNTNLSLKFSNFNFECPQYISITNSYSDNALLIQPSTSSTSWIFEGRENYADENAVLAKYHKYAGSNTDFIGIYKDGINNTYIARYQNEISISNMNEMISRFESGDYPKYIIKIKGRTEYIFVDNLKNEDGINIETDEVYINKDKVFPKGTGLGDEKIYETCRELFGDTFLQLLYDYVFKAIWIGVPILLIVLTSLDFAKVVFVEDKDGIQKAFRNFGKRAIVAVLIFLTPYIVILIANLTGAGTTVQSCAKTIREMGNTIK